MVLVDARSLVQLSCLWSAWWDGESLVAQKATNVSLQRLDFVHPCSMVTLLVGASLDYPQLLRLALPNTLNAWISSVSFLVVLCTSSYSDICSCAESFDEIYAWRFLRVLLGGVGWGLGRCSLGEETCLDVMFAKRLLLSAQSDKYKLLAFTLFSRAQRRRIDRCKVMDTDRGPD